MEQQLDCFDSSSFSKSHRHYILLPIDYYERLGDRYQSNAIR